MNASADVVAVVGAGRIGLPVVANLARAGYRVRVFDVRPEVESEVRTAGAEWFGSPADAVAGADAVLTVLPGSPELRDAMLGVDGLLDHWSGSTGWI